MSDADVVDDALVPWKVLWDIGVENRDLEDGRREAEDGLDHVAQQEPIAQ
jgi:hypothetical protein